MKFEQWWSTGTRSPNNPYKADSPAFWAWEGWQAGVGIEREECAQVCEEGGKDESGRIHVQAWGAAKAIRARGEKPWVKTYAGGKPNYTEPVDAVDINQERVDGTAKREHEQKEWVGLTEDEMRGLYQMATYMDETDYIHMLMMAEAKLKEKNDV